MSRCSTLMLPALALALALLGLVLQSAEVDAQERAKIEIVPQIAHARDIELGRLLAQWRARADRQRGRHIEALGYCDDTARADLLGPQGRRHRSRAFAGRYARAVGQQGQDDQALGGCNRTADPHHLRAPGRDGRRGQLRGVLTRWQASPVEQSGRGRGQAVGRGERPARADVSARQGIIARRRHLGRVLSRWHPRWRQAAPATRS